MNDLVYAPGPRSDFVELSRTQQGRLFRKHVLTKGTLNYPGVIGGKVEIDDDFISTLIDNFDKKVCDIVQIPVAGAENEHTEDPDRNMGEVVELKREGDKVYAYLDARDEDRANKLGKTLLGASALMSLNYTDHRDNEKKGPTLLHVAVTNRPHIVDLDGYEELLAASAEGSKDAVLLTAPSEEKNMPTKEELIAALKAEHGVDVVALSASLDAATAAAKAPVTPETVQLSAEQAQVLNDSGIIALSAGKNSLANEDVLATLVGSAEKVIALSASVKDLSEKSAKATAEHRVDELIGGGFITPAHRESQIELALSNSELFEKLVPTTPIVALSAEAGEDIPDEAAEKTVADEVLRLTNVAKANGQTVSV